MLASNFGQPFKSFFINLSILIIFRLIQNNITEIITNRASISKKAIKKL